MLTLKSLLAGCSLTAMCLVLVDTRAPTAAAAANVAAEHPMQETIQGSSQGAAGTSQGTSQGTAEGNAQGGFGSSQGNAQGGFGSSRGNAQGGFGSSRGTTRGKILFLRCASCHDLTTAPSAKIGPNLDGIVGRQVASVEGFKYSAALKSQNFVWDAAHLDAWLTNPNSVAPGTAMAFAGIAQAADRQAIIGYLETQHGAAP
jgi:cytochrome c